MSRCLWDAGLLVVAVSHVIPTFSSPDDTARRRTSLGCQDNISFTEHIIDDSFFGGSEHAYAADLDGDGDIDVLSSSIAEDTIAWYENDGGSPPSFTKFIITDFALGATAVYAADVDGDGDIDVLSASFDDDTIAWYENDGGFPPFFERKVITDLANGAMSVYAADLDNDGDIDVLSASWVDDTVAWYRNDGESPPIFEKKDITILADGAHSVYAADLDNDGDVDVLAASWNDDTIAWFEHDGGSPPVFERREISTLENGAASVYAADLDDDGDIDVLSAAYFGDTIAWHDNDGGSPPNFTPRVITATADFAYSVFAADVNNDGAIDVISAGGDANALAWYQSDGGFPLNFVPHFEQKFIENAMRDGDSMYAVDIDSDDDLDLLFASGDDGAVAWYENNCVPNDLTRTYSPTYKPTELPTPQPAQPLFPSPPTATGRRRCTHDISFAEHVITTSAMRPWEVRGADFDGDGDIDVLSVSSDDNAVAWYQNDGESPPSFKKIDITNLAHGAESVYAADLDGDDDLDILSASQDDDTIAWYENDRGSRPSFERKVIDTSATGATSVYATDLDRDGDIDVLAACEFDGTIAWYANDGGSPPIFEKKVITTFASSALSVYAADLDDDGDTDVLSASWSDNTIAWYVNDGGSAPSFERVVITNSADSAHSVHAADLDNDGDIDVLSASWNDGTIAWYDNDGESPPSFTSRVVSAMAPGACSVVAADLDNDGAIDVISASELDNTLAWYKSDDRFPPNFFPEYERKVINTTAVDPVYVYAVDIDKDGDMDVLLASADDHTVAWYENNCVLG